MEDTQYILYALYVAIIILLFLLLYIKISFSLSKKYKSEIYGDSESIPEYLERPYDNEAYTNTSLGRYLNSLIEKFNRYITPNFCLEHYVSVRSLKHYKNFDPYAELCLFAKENPDKFDEYIRKMQNNKNIGLQMLNDLKTFDAEKYYSKKSSLRQRQIDTIEALEHELEKDTKCRFTLSWSYYSGRKHEFYDVKFHKFTLNEMMNIKRSLEKNKPIA